MPANTSNYRGRFAPSPTGPLHLGSLIAALASYLDARHHGGEWLVRMEDLDPPRAEPGAAAAILEGLEKHGLDWDGTVLWQGERDSAYNEALDRLSREGKLFDCICTRAELGPDGVCAGRCAQQPRGDNAARALRLRVPPGTVIQFVDRLQGRQAMDLDAALPDFTLRRKDGLYAYQLAVVVDDAAQGIT
ncbi:MAG: tRNA glutamyl-Q(34) synthetase GluQRS, partial [Halioglobus sp.]|nr:tRNA glutamyl-Q(34) synthetase GluQRS [Halioglobus sp.]